MGLRIPSWWHCGSNPQVIAVSLVVGGGTSGTNGNPIHVWIDSGAGFPWATLITAVIGLLAAVGGVFIGNYLTKQREEVADEKTQSRQRTLELRERRANLRGLSLLVEKSLLVCDVAIAGSLTGYEIADPVAIQQASTGTSVPTTDISAVTSAASEMNRVWVTSSRTVTPSLATAIDTYRAAARRLINLADTSIQQVSSTLRDLPVE